MLLLIFSYIYCVHSQPKPNIIVKMYFAVNLDNGEALKSFLQLKMNYLEIVFLKCWWLMQQAVSVPILI